jgi:hypothetical protein
MYMKEKILSIVPGYLLSLFYKISRSADRNAWIILDLTMKKSIPAPHKQLQTWLPGLSHCSPTADLS